MQRLARPVALGLAVLSLLAAGALAVVVAPDEGMPVQFWALVAWLAVPALGALWYHGRTIAAPTVWNVVWVTSLVLSVAALSIAAPRNLNPANPDPEFGPLTVLVVIAVQAASALWAGLAGSRSLTRKREPSPA